MNTTNYPSGYPENQPPKKDFRNLFIGLFAIAFMGSLGYAVYEGNHHHQIQQTQQLQIAKIADDKSHLQRNFDDALTRLDSMKSTGNRIQGLLSGSENDIAKMKVEIRKLLNKQNLTESEKKKAQSLINELNQKISNMVQEVARLTQDNQNLGADNAKLTQDKQQLTSDLQTTAAAKDELTKKVDVASTFNASNIMITPVQLKKNGEEKVTDKAKRVDELKVSFDVSNRIAVDGQADVYVCITAPDGKLLSVPAMGSGTFTTRDNGEKGFTSKVSVDFEAGKVKPVQFVWKQESGFQTGPYVIEIYHNGFKIGEATKELKKGGIF